MVAVNGNRNVDDSCCGGKYIRILPKAQLQVRSVDMHLKIKITTSKNNASVAVEYFGNCRKRIINLIAIIARCYFLTYKSLWAMQ